MPVIVSLTSRDSIHPQPRQCTRTRKEASLGKWGTDGATVNVAQANGTKEIKQSAHP